jgi:hypothetical protein
MLLELHREADGAQIKYWLFVGKLGNVVDVFTSTSLIMSL